MSEVEIINLETPNGACSTKIADLPVATYSSTPSFIDNKLSVCGGANIEEGYTNACYEYDKTTNSWYAANGLSEPRNRPSSSVIGNEWFIAGGSPTALSTEIRENGVSSPGPTLPDGISWGCQVTINETHVFLTDGEELFTYVLEWESEFWTTQVLCIKIFHFSSAVMFFFYNDHTK